MEVFEAMEIDTVPELEREKDQPNEKQFRDRMDQAAVGSYLETHIPSVVGTKFSTIWNRGGGGKERKYRLQLLTKSRPITFIETTGNCSQQIQVRACFMSPYRSIYTKSQPWPSSIHGSARIERLYLLEAISTSDYIYIKALSTA